MTHFVRMPLPLSDYNSLTLLPTNNLPNYSTPPPTQPSYRDYTVIEDVMACTNDVPPAAYQAPQGTPTYGGGYNSNGIFPATHQALCPSQAQQAYTNLIHYQASTSPQTSATLQSTQYYTPQATPGVTPGAYPRAVQPFAAQVAAYNYSHPQYATIVPSAPPFLGAVPDMKNALRLDNTVPLREGYAATAVAGDGSSIDSCVDCLNHVNSCKLCKKMTQSKLCALGAEGSGKGKYIAVIVVLILVIFGMIGWMMYKRKKQGVSIIPERMTQLF